MEKETVKTTEAATASDSTEGMKRIVISFLKWILIACIAGIADGAAGALFHHALDLAAELRTKYSFLLFALPAAGLLIVLIYSVSGMKNDKGTNGVILAARGKENMSLKTAPLIFAATFLTHLFGGSAGREGAALQIGASVVSPLGKIFKMDKSDSSILAMCGMAAGFSALFGTPAAAAVFAMEVTVVGAAQYTAVIPCFFAAAIAGVVASAMGVSPTSFGVTGVPVFGSGSAVTLLQTAVVGIACALASILFCKAMHTAGRLYKKYISNEYLRAAAGGVIVIILTLLMGTRDYNGAGTDVIERAFAGECFPAAFLLKILFTALTLGAGFKGGEIVPSFFVGSTLGCLVGGLIGLDPSFGAALGLVGVFCGVTNCPIASIILSAELFGVEGIVFYAAAASVSYMLSGYEGLYSEQTFFFAKDRLENKDKYAFPEEEELSEV